MTSKSRLATAIKPIFVVGYGHSGTTLLRNIVKNNSSVYASPVETKFFEHLFIIKQSFPTLEDDSVLADFVVATINMIRHGVERSGLPSLKKTTIVHQFYNDIYPEAIHDRDHCKIFRITFDHFARKAGKSRWLEKTPAHVFHMDRILKCIPDAQFIEIVRDPRDVLASKKTRRSNIWKTDRYGPEQRLRKHLEKGYDPFWDTLSWKSAISSGRNAQREFPDSALSIQYENLVQDPTTCVHRICDFLNMEYEAHMLSVSSGNPADATRKTKTKNYGLTAKSIGRWVSVLPSSEVAVCQSLAKQEMDCLGYSKTQIGLRENLKVPFVLANSMLDLFKRMYRKTRLGGVKFLANTLAAYSGRLAGLIGLKGNRDRRSTGGH